MANHSKSQAYKAVLNFFRNTLGFDRKLIGQLVRHAVERVAVRELNTYLKSNRWVPRDLNQIIKDSVRDHVRQNSGELLNRQLRILDLYTANDTRLDSVKQKLVSILDDPDLCHISIRDRISNVILFIDEARK